jgi:hypothetical protein
VDLIEGYSVMAGYDDFIFGAGMPGFGSDGIVKGEKRLVKTAEVEKDREKVVEMEMEKIAIKVAIA